MWILTLISGVACRSDTDPFRPGPTAAQQSTAKQRREDTIFGIADFAVANEEASQTRLEADPDRVPGNVQAPHPALPRAEGLWVLTNFGHQDT